MTYWTVPPMWAGKTVAVLASGPSMSAEVAAAVRHLPRIAVNTTYRLAPDAEVIYACDAQWWKQNPEALLSPVIKVCVEPLRNCRPAVHESINVLRNSGTRGFDPSPNQVRTLNNSGAQALQVAAHAKASTILLCGFDMRGGHWHGDHEPPLGNASAGKMAQWAESFRDLAHGLSALGVEVLNCTPGSALDCFPHVRLSDALAEHLEAAA